VFCPETIHVAAVVCVGLTLSLMFIAIVRNLWRTILRVVETGIVALMINWNMVFSVSVVVVGIVVAMVLNVFFTLDGVTDIGINAAIDRLIGAARPNVVENGIVLAIVLNLWRTMLRVVDLGMVVATVRNLCVILEGNTLTSGIVI
jgi:hypothetical protein